MILYKYVSYEVAKLIIETSRIGFSCIEDLNDPFEGTSLRFRTSDDLPERVVLGAVRERMSRNFGVLSLTRTPLNPTMWSHYGDDHRGVVLGIDVNIANLNCTKRNVIPANNGGIFYIATKPSTELPKITAKRLMEIGAEIGVQNEYDFEIFKRTFLFKALPWIYEEEVRVVKNINYSRSSRYTNSQFKNPAGDWSTVQYQGRPIYCLSVPENAVKEVYLGCATYKNISRLGVCKEKYSQLKTKWTNKGISVFNVRQVPNSWQLESYIHKGC